MPSCRITNQTSQPLNICLKQVTALHFENAVQPGQTIKLRPGRVWFTLEALVDDGSRKSRYSVIKSAATIALLSIAAGAVAVTAGAALLPEGAALGAAGAVATLGGYLAKGMTVTKTALVKNSGSIAKVSSMALPKAIDKISAEAGGMNALQREVLSIVSSPNVKSDVRHNATNLLKQLHGAYTKDKADRAAKKAGESADTTDSNPPSTASGSSNTKRGTSISSTKDEPPKYLDPMNDQEEAALHEEVEAGEWDDRVEKSIIQTGHVLRVHGLYMSKRREFEIRVGPDGKLELWDAKEKMKWK